MVEEKKPTQMEQSEALKEKYGGAENVPSYEPLTDEERAEHGLVSEAERAESIELAEKRAEKDAALRERPETIKAGDTWTTDKGTFVVNTDGSITQYALGYGPEGKIEEEKSTLAKVGEALFGNPFEAGLPEGEQLVGTPLAIGVPGVGGGTVLKMVGSAKHMQILTAIADKAAAIYKGSKLVRAIVMSVATAAVIGSVGGKVFTKFLGMEEASQIVNIAGRDALMRGDLEGYAIAAAQRDEILRDQTFWESLAEWIPWYNVLVGLEKYRQTGIAGATVYDRMYEDAKIKAEAGEDDVTYWARIRQQQLDMEKASIDYYNEERKKMVEWELEAEAKAARTGAEEYEESRERQRELDEAARQKEQKEFEASREKERAAEEAAREKAAAEYAKSFETKLAMEEESRRAGAAAYAEARETERALEWEQSEKEREAAAEARRIAYEEYAESSEKERAAERKVMLEEAAFWRKERAKQRELEAAERVAIAEFWLAYRMEIQKIKSEQSISNLNFGLL